MVWLAQLNLAAGAVGTLLALALLTRTGPNHRGWRWLGALLGLSVIPVVMMVLYETRWIERYPDLIGIHTPIAFLIGPLFYFFVLAFTDPKRRLHLLDALHLLPFGLYVWWLWPIYTAPDDVKIARSLAAFYNDTPSYQRTQLVHMTVLLVHLGGYIALALWRSRGEPFLRLPRLPALGVVAIWGVLALRFVLDAIGPWTTVGTALVVPTAISMLLLAIGFQGMRRGAPASVIRALGPDPTTGR